MRLGGLYQFLCDHGHDVRVVAAQAQGVAREANANYNPDEVRHVSYRSLESILLKIRERLKSQEKTSAVKQSASRSVPLRKKQSIWFPSRPDNEKIKRLY